MSCWRWLQAKYLKNKKESLFVAVQDQALATKAYTVTTLKQQGFKKGSVKICYDLAVYANTLQTK